MDPVSIATIVLTTIKVCSQIGTGIYELHQKYGLVNASLEALRIEVAVISATLTRAKALTANASIKHDGIEEHKGVLEALVRGCGAELNSLRLLIVRIQDRLATCPQIMRLTYLAFRQEEIRSAMESIRVQNSALSQFLGCLSCENTLHMRHALQEVREAIARGIATNSKQSCEPLGSETAAASHASLSAIAPSDSDSSSDDGDGNTFSEKEAEQATLDPAASSSPSAQKRPPAITTTETAAPVVEPEDLRSPTLVEPDVESILRRSKPYQRARAESTAAPGNRSPGLQRSESSTSSSSQPTLTTSRPSPEAQPFNTKAQAAPNCHPQGHAPTSAPSQPQVPLSAQAVAPPPPPSPPKTGAPTIPSTTPQGSRPSSSSRRSYLQTRKPLSAYMLEEFVAQRDAHMRSARQR